MLKAGDGNHCDNMKCIRNGEECGKGIYFTPFFSQALVYAKVISLKIRE